MQEINSCPMGVFLWMESG